MKTFKLVFLIFSLFLLLFCSKKTTEQKNISNRPKEQVVAFELPKMDEVMVKNDIPYLKNSDSALKMDIYYPPNFDFKTKLPAIIIVYGLPNDVQITLAGEQLRKWSWHVSWCKIFAASGIAAIAYETVDPVNDIVSLAKYIHSNEDKLMIDTDNIGAFAFSGHTPTAISNILNPAFDIFKCAAIYYGFFLTQDFEFLPQVDSISQIMRFETPRLPDPRYWRKNVPILIVRAGLDNVPFLNQSVQHFYLKAIDHNLPITLINYPTGSHGFEVYDDNDTTRFIIQSTLDFWDFNLNKK